MRPTSLRDRIRPKKTVGPWFLRIRKVDDARATVRYEFLHGDEGHAIRGAGQQFAQVSPVLGLLSRLADEVSASLQTAFPRLPFRQDDGGPVLCDVDGHPEQPGLRRAFEELAFFSSSMKILGAYRAHPYRLEQSAPAE